MLLVASVVFGCCRPSCSAADEFLSVQVKQGQVRSTPSFLGNVTANLAYGDKVNLIEDKGAWKNVAIRKIKGWMHVSALTTKPITLQAGKDGVKSGATSGELSLAGKGFSAKVEAEFKSKNKNVNYSQVDKMEALLFKSSQMQTFLKQGLVTMPEEVAP
jgi:hypothetical protein